MDIIQLLHTLRYDIKTHCTLGVDRITETENPVNRPVFGNRNRNLWILITETETANCGFLITETETGKF